MAWTGFALIFAAFFATHSLPLRPAVRSRITRQIGTRGFGLVYSALSLAMLGVLIRAAGQAPDVQIWPQALWQRHAVQLGMVAVCLILALSLGRPNPFSFGGARNDRFDPARPGIIRWMRHPVLVALTLWAGLHLLPNGDLAHVILFGALGCFALAGQFIMDRRWQARLGAGQWRILKEATIAAPRFHRPNSWPLLALRLGTGMAGFFLLLAAHPVVIGVPAL
jgi:uncharacterized membrane protein